MSRSANVDTPKLDTAAHDRVLGAVQARPNSPSYAHDTSSMSSGKHCVKSTRSSKPSKLLRTLHYAFDAAQGMDIVVDTGRNPWMSMDLLGSPWDRRYRT
ncbi:hypothetical protein FRC11_012415 [Ceratobasidium sp. 423]|nr:hypothetical protein FRC11_012415 [Ceratobasidium sp. 423]